MADDERRAEIEAVARALAQDELGRESGWPAYRRQAATVLQYLDRVRDARGDDEAHDRLVAGLFHDLKDLGRERDNLKAEVKRLSRSPQDEDHEAAVEAAHEALGHWDGWRAFDADAVPDLIGWMVETSIGAYLARVSPSRDGTVAVEDVERLVDALRRIERLKDRWQAPLRHPVGDMGDPAYAGAAAWAAVGSEAHKIAVDALAEFARPATGEQTDHGG